MTSQVKLHFQSMLENVYHQENAMQLITVHQPAICLLMKIRRTLTTQSQPTRKGTTTSLTNPMITMQEVQSMRTPITQRIHSQTTTLTSITTTMDSGLIMDLTNMTMGMDTMATTTTRMSTSMTITATIMKTIMTMATDTTKDTTRMNMNTRTSTETSTMAGFNEPNI